MTAPELDLLAAFRKVFGDPPPWSVDSRPDPATYEDEETLRRSFGGLSKYARNIQRRPERIVVDEHGHDRHGRYYADRDGVW